MPHLIPPISEFDSRTINGTLHGRSVYRSRDVPGHNVFKGYSTWESNGHVGVGDALDLGGQGWRTPVVAIADGVQTLWRNDMNKLEVIYLEGEGYCAVYAHINATHEGTGMAIRQGEPLGVLRGDLAAPHLHFELWLADKAVSASTPEGLRAKMLEVWESGTSGPTLLGLDGRPVPNAGAFLSTDGILYSATRATVEACGKDLLWNDQFQTARIMEKA